MQAEGHRFDPDRLHQFLFRTRDVWPKFYSDTKTFVWTFTLGLYDIVKRNA